MEQGRRLDWQRSINNRSYGHTMLYNISQGVEDPCVESQLEGESGLSPSAAAPNGDLVCKFFVIRT